MTFRYRMRVAAATALVCLAAASPARAHDCAGIAEDAKRLLCYDAAFGRAAPTLPAMPAMPSGAVAGPTAGAPPATPATPAQAASAAAVAEAEKAHLKADAKKGRSLVEAWDLDPDTALAPFELRAYKPMYLQILSHTNKVNSRPSSAQAANNVVTPLDLQSNELQFQLSFKTKAWDRILGNNGSLWLGYTQTSRWQAYNASNSRPFRETNYEPEAMFVLNTPGNIAGWQSRMSSVSLTHQSNGQSSPLSRSWNRVIGQWGLEKDNTTLLIRPWWRIPEKAARDDNPGIENFVGRGELVLAHRMGEHVVSFQGRHALRTGENARGSAKIDWAIPMAGYLKAHLSLFSGYGESLVDYNHRQTRIGLGVSLVEWR